jgi:predicted NBD/HSP70 family sugar kinase
VDSSVDYARHDPAEAVVSAVQALSRKARIARKRLLHVRLGIPGSYDESADLVHHIDVPGWSRPGLVGEIRRRLRTDVAVDNDVNLAAIAERRSGAVTDRTGRSGFALLWLGSEGLGLAVDLGDRLLRGTRGGAGEIGYVPVATSGRHGRQDFQDLVGGPAVLELARTAGFSADTPDQAVALAVRSEDRAAHRFLDELGERIALGLAAVVAVLDPPLIVLSGEIGQAGGTRLRDAVAAALRSVFSLAAELAPTGVTDADPVLLGARHASVVALQDRLLATLAAG